MCSFCLSWPAPLIYCARFILANTEELHAKISSMSHRIQELEDAVACLQAALTGGREPHPLLREDLLAIKSSAELHRAQMAGNANSTGSNVKNMPGEGDLHESHLDPPPKQTHGPLPFSMGMGVTPTAESIPITRIPRVSAHQSYYFWF